MEKLFLFFCYLLATFGAFELEAASKTQAQASTQSELSDRPHLNIPPHFSMLDLEQAISQNWRRVPEFRSLVQKAKELDVEAIYLFGAEAVNLAYYVLRDLESQRQNLQTNNSTSATDAVAAVDAVDVADAVHTGYAIHVDDAVNKGHAVDVADADNAAHEVESTHNYKPNFDYDLDDNDIFLYIKDIYIYIEIGTKIDSLMDRDIPNKVWALDPALRAYMFLQESLIKWEPLDLGNGFYTSRVDDVNKTKVLISIVGSISDEFISMPFYFKVHPQDQQGFDFAVEDESGIVAGMVIFGDKSAFELIAPISFEKLLRNAVSLTHVDCVRLLSSLAPETVAQAVR